MFRPWQNPVQSLLCGLALDTDLENWWRMMSENAHTLQAGCVGVKERYPKRRESRHRGIRGGLRKTDNDEPKIEIAETPDSKWKNVMGSAWKKPKPTEKS